MLALNDIIGSWRLVSCTEERDGALVETFGNEPVGQIQYSGNRRMSAFLMHKAWPDSPSDGRFNPDLPFFSYAGPFEFDGEMVRHQVEMSSQPLMIGQTLERLIERDGDQLRLSSPAQTVDGITINGQTLLWQRV